MHKQRNSTFPFAAAAATCVAASGPALVLFLLPRPFSSAHLRRCVASHCYCLRCSDSVPHRHRSAPPLLLPLRAPAIAAPPPLLSPSTASAVLPHPLRCASVAAVACPALRFGGSGPLQDIFCPLPWLCGGAVDEDRHCLLLFDPCGLLDESRQGRDKEETRLNAIPWLERGTTY
jgi:hypothetical protein